MNKGIVSLFIFSIVCGFASIESQHGCLQISHGTQTAENESQKALENRLETLEIEDKAAQQEKTETASGNKENHWNESEGGHCVVS